MENESFVRRHWFLIVFSVIFLIFCCFIFYSLFYQSVGSSESIKELVNPASNLSIEEAVVQFDSGFVNYLLYSIGAWQLHNPPLSSDTPKIEILVGNEIYNAVVEKNQITVRKGSMESEDMVIIVTKEEAVKMMKDSNYIKESFKSENSRIELVAGKTTLFMKGYLNLYNQIIGE